MGQKTNPNIFRVGKVKEWKSKYIEKKSTESSTIIFRDLEIKKLVFQMFAKNKLQIHNCRVYYAESSLHIYISYFNFFSPPTLNKPKRVKTYSKPFHSKTFKIKKNNAKKQIYIAKAYKKTVSEQNRLKLVQNFYFLNKKTQRLNIINNLKIHQNIKNYNTLDSQRTKLFISKLFKSLAIFTKKKQAIFLNLKQLNKETTFFQTILKKNKLKLKKNLTSLRRFQKHEFFKEGLNILNTFAMNDNNSLFLAKFIASCLKKLKRPNILLRFLDTVLKKLAKKKFCKFKRIRIKIKGRFNGAPRSRHKFVKIGPNLPMLKLNSKIDYGESTAYTANGTFGIKVWTYSKTM